MLQISTACFGGYRLLRKALLRFVFLFEKRDTVSSLLTITLCSGNYRRNYKNIIIFGTIDYQLLRKKSICRKKTF